MSCWVFFPLMGSFNFFFYGTLSSSTVNVLKFRTPNIIVKNNFWKCPKISNSSSFAKREFLKFRTQLSPSNFYRYILISINVFCFFFRYRTEN